MASYVGSATGTNSVTMPTHQAGDLLIAFATNDGSTTVPTAPAGWNSVVTSAINTFGAIVARQVATSSSMTSGTWTNANGLLIMVYRPTAGYRLDTGGNGFLCNSAGISMAYPAITTLQTPATGTSWCVRMAAHKDTTTALETPPTGYTNRANAVIGSVQEMSGHDSNGVVSSVAQSNFITLGGVNTAYIVVSVELMELPLILFRSSSTVAYGASHTNTVLTAPAGLANDDIMIAAVFVGAASPPTVTPPTGFTEISGSPTAVDDAGGFLGNLHVYWKRAASESGSYTFTHASASSNGYLGAYAGCITSGSPIDVSSSNHGDAVDHLGGSTATALSVTTTAVNDLLLYIAHDWEGTGTLSPPTGFTERYDNLVYVADVMQAATGASGNKTQTNANTGAGQAPWSAFLVALKAAVAAGSTTNKTVDISCGVSVGAVKRVNKIVSIAAGVTVAATRQARKIVSIAAGVTVAAVKQARKIVSLTAAVAVSVSAIRVFLKTVNISVGVTVTGSRQARKIVSIAASASVAAVKRVNKVVAVNAAVAVTASAIRVFLKTVNISVGVSVNASRQARKIVNVAAGVTVGAVKRVNKTVSLSAAVSVDAVKQVGKVISLTCSTLVAVLTSSGVGPAFEWTKRVVTALFDMRQTAASADARTVTPEAETRTVAAVVDSRSTDAEGI